MFEVMKEVNVIAVFSIKEECREDLLKSFKQVVDETRKESGVISYVLHQDTKDSLKYVMLETWKSKDALATHEDTAHFKKLIADIEGKVTNLTVQVVEKIY